MSREGLGAAWSRVEPVVVWGALGNMHFVLFVAIWSLYTVDSDELRARLTSGLPGLVALAVLPILGTLVATRLFTAGIDAAVAWFDRIVVGVAAMSLLPLLGEAVRWALVVTLLDNVGTPETDSWTWLLFVLPITVNVFAVGTIVGQILGRFWLASLVAYLVSFAFAFGTIMVLDNREPETGLWVASGVSVVLYAMSWSVFAVRGGATARAFVPTVLSLCVVGVAGSGLSQHMAFDREKIEMEALRDSLARDVGNAKLTTARLSEFHREVERKKASREALRRILPETLDVPAFMARFEELAGTEAVRLGGYEVSTNSYDFYEEAIVAIELAGDDGGIAALEDRVNGIVPLVHWRSLSNGPAASPSGTKTPTVTVALYAMPRPPPFSRPHPCPPSTESAVWFWPYAYELARHRDEISEICAERTGLESMIQQIRLYQDTLVEIEELERLIERFRADRKK